MAAPRVRWWGKISSVGSFPLHDSQGAPAIERQRRAHLLIRSFATWIDFRMGEGWLVERSTGQKVQFILNTSKKFPPLDRVRRIRFVASINRQHWHWWLNCEPVPWLWVEDEPELIQLWVMEEQFYKQRWRESDLLSLFELPTVHAFTGFYFLPGKNDDTLLLQRPAVGLSISLVESEGRRQLIFFAEGKKFFPVLWGR